MIDDPRELNDAAIIKALSQIKKISVDRDDGEKSNASAIIFLPWQLQKFFEWTIEDIAAEFEVSIESAKEMAKEPEWDGFKP